MSLHATRWMGTAVGALAAFALIAAAATYVYAQACTPVASAFCLNPAHPMPLPTPPSTNCYVANFFPYTGHCISIPASLGCGPTLQTSPWMPGFCTGGYYGLTCNLSMRNYMTDRYFVKCNFDNPDGPVLGPCRCQVDFVDQVLQPVCDCL